MATKTEKVISKALELLRSAPGGIRVSELVRRLEKELPGVNVNTIASMVWNLHARQPDAVFKPARGLFRHVSFRDEPLQGDEPENVPVQENQTKPLQKANESAFYEPFAEYLVHDLEECTKAVALGGNKFGGKWGTPDVLGIREPGRSDPIKPPTEIVAGEVKINVADLITAFGQACSYKLFSHKSYLVIPNDSSPEDIARLDALCRGFGIGLILFDRNNPEEPNFDIRVRATKHEPDMFYVNKNIKLVEGMLF